MSYDQSDSALRSFARSAAGELLTSRAAAGSIVLDACRRAYELGRQHGRQPVCDAIPTRGGSCARAIDEAIACYGQQFAEAIEILRDRGDQGLRWCHLTRIGLAGHREAGKWLNYLRRQGRLRRLRYGVYAWVP